MTGLPRYRLLCTTVILEKYTCMVPRKVPELITAMYRVPIVVYKVQNYVDKHMDHTLQPIHFSSQIGQIF